MAYASRPFAFDGSEDAGIGAPLYRNALDAPVELLPNPDFVFPLPTPDADPALSGLDVPSSTGRQPRSLQARRHSAQRKSVNTLPEFSFNPSGASSVTSPTTPPVSPLPTSPSTPRNVGHRRGGSEFIGGDGRPGGVGLMSSSPTKGDAILPPPAPNSNATLRPGPPAGRRGHAHRRSGAISCHDLASIVQPPSESNPTARGGSAPSTPMESEMSSWPRHAANKSVSHPSLRTFTMEGTEQSQDDPNSTRRPPSRARVGFSDRVEYIRPLSTISSETEGSMSTIRGHSVSNSLSSVISAGAPSPPSTRMARPSLNTTFEDVRGTSRPKTAGAVLDKTSKFKEGFSVDLFGRQRPVTAANLPSPSSPLSPLASPATRQPAKKRNFFTLNHRKAQTSAEMLTSNSEPSLVGSPSDSPPSSPFQEPVQEPPNDGLDAPRPKEKSKKARKVKSWTNPFSSKKPKSPTTRPTELNQRPPTPPPVSPPVEELDLDELSHNFDVDDTVTIVTPTNDVMPRPQPQLNTDFASWKPKHVSPADSESRSPIIDLDLAMGPFESAPRGRGANGRNFASARRTMHSSGFAAGVFTQPLNHRRTESAPVLAPFELRKAASTSAMADVFEEEEEDVSEDAPPAPSKPASTVTPQAQPEEAQPDAVESEDPTEPAEEDESNIGIQVVESDMEDGAPINWNFDNGLGIQRTDRARASTPDLEAPPSPRSKPVELAENPDPVEVVEDYEEPRTSSLTRSSDSTVTPTMEEGPKELQPPMSLPVPLPQQNLMTPDTVTSSSFPSPEIRYRQNSFEVPRLGTASSIADTRTLNSLVLGEPGPELRISVDDVPSLTSSRSTMTSALHGGFPLLSPRNPGDRASSVSSAPSAISERRRKRSSIASLSRLMTANFSERSKLHIEQRPQSEHMDLLNMSKKSKEKKPKRLSKLMQFWRSSSSK